MARKIDPPQPTAASAVWLPYESDLLTSLIQILGQWNSASFQSRLAQRSGLQLDAISISAIYALGRAGSLRPSELASQLRISAPSASKLLGRLTDAGLAVRVADARDSRASSVRLTATGSRAAMDLFAEGDSITSALLEGWSTADRNDLVRLMHRFADSTAAFEPEAQKTVRQGSQSGT